MEENPKTKEETIPNAISKILSLPLGVHPRAELILVLLKKKPAGEIYVSQDENIDEVLDAIHSVGLFAEKRSSNANGPGVANNICVASSRGTLEEVCTLFGDKDHKKYGTLMGFPDSAIRAFVSDDEMQRMEQREQDALLAPIPNIVNHFKFSRSGSRKEFGVFLDWVLTIYHYAPSLIDELYPKDDAKRFKENLKSIEGQLQEEQ